MEWKVVVPGNGDCELHLSGLPEGEIKLIMPAESYQKLGHQKAYALMSQWAKIQNTKVK